MKEIGRLVIVLTMICTVAAVALSQVYILTKEPIEAAIREEKLKAIRKVLPDYNNEPDRDVVSIPIGKDENGSEITKDYYIARMNGEVVGVAFEASSREGYGGNVGLMVGVDLEGSIFGVEVVTHAETPGLGSKITGEKFLSIFSGRDLDNTRWSVKKDGGDIDQITGATISPRAVVSAVYMELENFKKMREEILSSALTLEDAG
jgi:electron transport complex protein RnfG